MTTISINQPLNLPPIRDYGIPKREKKGYYEAIWGRFEASAQTLAGITALRTIGVVSLEYFKDVSWVHDFLKAMGQTASSTCGSFRHLAKCLGGKEKLFNVTVFRAPIREELVCRGLIQEVILRQILQRALSAKPESEETKEELYRDKVVRVLVSSTIFSAVHLLNLRVLPVEYVAMQVASTFIGGIALGVVKESRAGLVGAIAAHSLNNYVAHKIIQLICNASRGS